MLRSHARQADKLSVVESFDKFAGLRHALGQIGKDTAEWAGVPMPLDDQNLVIEPKYPNAAKLMAIGGRKVDGADYELPEGVSVRNTFWSTRHRMEVVIWNEPDGKITHSWVPGQMRAGMELTTLGASIAWGIEQEHNALNLLGTMLNHHRFKQYLLTGMFLETSKRSGLTYLFRKLRPTVVLSMKGSHVRVMCALCLHPIGYYAGSWAGAMCPTDDVIAHLALMRGDEPMFWRRANQHSPLRPEAGL